MITQFENARDRNIETAWRHGGKFEGHKVTDSMFLEWWEKRASEVDSSDPMWDYYQQSLFQYRFQIGEQKISLKYEQGKVSETDVARWYVEQAGKVPKDSAVWRELMTNAAKFKKAAQTAAASRRSKAKVDTFADDWQAAYDKYAKPAAVVETIFGAYTTVTLDTPYAPTIIGALGNVSNRTGGSAATGEGREVIESETVTLQAQLAAIESDPRWDPPGGKGWKDMLAEADPSFHGHLTTHYLQQSQSRAIIGFKQQLRLARKKGYSSYVDDAQRHIDGAVATKHALQGFNAIGHAQELINTALESGMTDPTLSPDERERIRQNLKGKLQKLSDRAFNKGLMEVTGAIDTDIKWLDGKPLGSKRAGTEGPGEGISQLGQTIGRMAVNDKAQLDLLAKGKGFEVRDEAGNPVIVDRDSMPPPAQGVRLTLKRTKGTPDHPSVSYLAREDGIPMKVEVAAMIDPFTGEPLAKLPDQSSGIVGYFYPGKDGDEDDAWGVILNDGTVQFTHTDPFSSANVQKRGINSDGKGYTVTINPGSSGRRGAIQVPDPNAPADDPGRKVWIADPRAALDDKYTKGDRPIDQTLSGKIDDGPGGSGANVDDVTATFNPDGTRKLTAPKVGEAALRHGFNDAQWANIQKLPPELRDYVIDRGLTSIPADATADQVRAVRDGKGVRTEGGQMVNGTVVPGKVIPIEEDDWKAKGHTNVGDSTPYRTSDDIMARIRARKDEFNREQEQAGRQGRGGNINTDPEYIKLQSELMHAGDGGAEAGEAPPEKPFNYSQDATARRRYDSDYAEWQQRRTVESGRPPEQIQADIDRLRGSWGGGKLATDAKMTELQSELAHSKTGQIRVAQGLVDTVTNVLNRIGFHDPVNPQTTGTALAYSKDSIKRQEYVAHGFTDEEIADHFAMDPNLNTVQKLGEAWHEVRRIQAGAHLSDNDFNAQIMREFGVPEPIIRRMGRPPGEASQLDAQRARIGLPVSRQMRDEDGMPIGDEEILNPDDHIPDGFTSGPFIWGGGKAPEFERETYGPPAPTNVPGIQPQIRMPNMVAGMQGSLDQALAAHRQQQAAAIPSRAIYDPVSRSMVQPQASKPIQTVIKTPKPPETHPIPDPKPRPAPPPIKPKKPIAPARPRTPVSGSIYQQGGGKPNTGGY
jgi:hypothetical protein